MQVTHNNLIMFVSKNINIRITNNPHLEDGLETLYQGIKEAFSDTFRNSEYNTELTLAINDILKYKDLNNSENAYSIIYSYLADVNKIKLEDLVETYDVEMITFEFKLKEKIEESLDIDYLKKELVRMNENLLHYDKLITTICERNNIPVKEVEEIDKELLSDK